VSGKPCITRSEQCAGQLATSSGALEHVAAPSHINGMAELQLQSTITCPHCDHQATDTMPANACVAFYDCKECGETLKPLPGSCCVFCSYGSVPCPPIQQGVEPCCDPLPRQSSRDWLGSTRTSLMAWWIPTALIIAALLVTAPFRMGIWVAALAWMGIACLLNVRQCGRTHCRYTGPYYLAMVVPVLIVGAGIVPLSLYGWLAFAIIILGGGYAIWWGTERAWGKFSVGT
jgi:hypothetical protein